MCIRALLEDFFSTLRDPHSEILGLLRNTLTVNDNYPVQDCENLSSPIEMHLSLERNFSSDLFVPFLEATSNFKNFEKNDDRHTYLLLEITECERLG